MEFDPKDVEVITNAPVIKVDEDVYYDILLGLPAFDTLPEEVQEELRRRI